MSPSKSAHLNTDPEERRAYPYAVGVTMLSVVRDETTGHMSPGEPEETKFIHFAFKPLADFYASLMEDDFFEVRRYVALSDEDYSGGLGYAHPNGWREVAYFVL